MTTLAVESRLGNHRFNLPSATAAPSAPPAAPRKKSRRPQPRKPITRNDGLHNWAHAVVYGAGLASCCLNGLARYTGSKEGMGVPSLIIGALVPVFTMLLFHVAGLLYRRRNNSLALKAAGVGLFLLFLSLYHCTESISLLMTCGWPLALPLAIGLDCGLVVCEWAIVSTD